MSLVNVMSVCAGVPLTQVKPQPPPEVGKDGTVLDFLVKNTGRSK